MPSTIEALEAEALLLPRPDRVRLVERLIATLDFDVAIDEAWAAEAERRNAEIEDGRVAAIPAARGVI